MYVPAAQGWHAAEDVLPEFGAYLPAAQSVQDNAPPVLYLPLEQVLQYCRLASLYLPAAQGWHAAEDVLPEFSVVVPAAQSVQETAPLVLYVLSGQI